MAAELVCPKGHGALRRGGTRENQPGVFCAKGLIAQTAHERMEAESWIRSLETTDHFRIALLILDIMLPQRQ